jgi:hypothetical protein
MSTVRPLRPRLVIRVARDGSLDFAATRDIEVIIVRAGWRRFRVFPSLKVGIGHVRRLLADGPKDREPATVAARARRSAT